MGQYHLTVNLDKREFLDPHKLGLGLKLLEQVGGYEATTGDILLLLLAVANGKGGGDAEEPEGTIERLIGRWGGDRIAVVGDYTEGEDMPNVVNAGDLYSLCRFWQEADEKGRIPSEIEYTKDYSDPYREAARERYRRMSQEARWTDISDLVIPMIHANFDIRIVTDSSGWRKREWKEGMTHRMVYLSPEQGDCLAAYARRPATQAKVTFLPATLADLSGRELDEELAAYDKARKINQAKRGTP